jgi:dethiobiotin synthetase
MRGLFVSATDTGAGKTLITAAIARQWRREGRAFRVCKPVATGASMDTRILGRAAGDNDLEAITPLHFEAEVAPPVAARLAGRNLTLEDLIEAVRRREEREAVLVEGVGGLLCPLTETETVADLAGRLGLPLVVVAKRSLGTLNHTLLTLEAARHRRLRVVGVVVNEVTPVSGVADETNVEELRRRIDVPILAVVPNLTAATEGEIPAISAVNWWSLIG